MNRKNTQQDYLLRIDRVQTYIHENLDSDLDLDTLAQMACFSHYHWHRIYHGMTGETVAQSVRRLRLLRAASQLIKSSMDIHNIAKRAGYGSVEAFSRAFRSAYGEPPAKYRGRTQEPPFPKQVNRLETTMYDIKVETLQPIKLAAIHHSGDYMGIAKSFEAAIIWMLQKDILKGPPSCTGIYYDDPSAVPPEDLRAEAGVVITENIEPETTASGEEIRTVNIPGGRHAVLVFKGPYAELQKPYTWLFGTWLPQSGEEAADTPAYENYLNDPKTTPPMELLTEICLPLRN